MRSLPEQFEGRRDTAGWLFRQIRRNGQYAIYERTRGDEFTYEVIRILKYASDKQVNGRFLARRGDEYYPKPSEWGIYAWSLMTREAAEAKYNEFTHQG
jgi:hypothetical protein